MVRPSLNAAGDVEDIAKALGFELGDGFGTASAEFAMKVNGDVSGQFARARGNQCQGDEA